MANLLLFLFNLKLPPAPVGGVGSHVLQFSQLLALLFLA